MMLRRRDMAWAAPALLALALSVAARSNARFPGDLELSRLVQSMDNAPLRLVTTGISLVRGEWLGFFVVAVGAILARRYMGLVESGVVAISGLVATINDIFKWLVSRPRPSPDLVSVLVRETGSSFPSGHAFFAIVVFGLLGYLVVVRQRRGNRRLAAVTFLLLILFIGFSRIYVGAHWASDVIAGYLAGLPFLRLEVWFYERLRARLQPGPVR